MMRIIVACLLVLVVMAAWMMVGTAQVWECPFDAHTCETVWYPNQTAAVCDVPTFALGDPYEEWCAPLYFLTETIESTGEPTPTQEVNYVPAQAVGDSFRFELSPFRFSR